MCQYVLVITISLFFYYSFFHTISMFSTPDEAFIPISRSFNFPKSDNHPRRELDPISALTLEIAHRFLPPIPLPYLVPREREERTLWVNLSEDSRKSLQSHSFSRERMRMRGETRNGHKWVTLSVSCTISPPLLAISLDN